MDSSNQLDIKKANQDIVSAFIKKGATNEETAIFVEELELSYPLKVQYYLIEEFVRNDFMSVLNDGKVFFNQKKYYFEKKKVQTIYFGIMLFPIIVGILLIVL